MNEELLKEMSKRGIRLVYGENDFPDTVIHEPKDNIFVELNKNGIKEISYYEYIKFRAENE